MRRPSVKSVHQPIALPKNRIVIGLMQYGPAELTDREADRYTPNRHFFAWIDTAARSSPYGVQARLKRAKVGLLGLGGTGTAVAAGLVASGVDHLHCAAATEQPRPAPPRPSPVAARSPRQAPHKTHSDQITSSEISFR